MASSIPASFWRGGTSNGLMVLRSNLPEDTESWASILCPAMGSPDFYSRQLNGMGGGISSLSKVCVISASERIDADIDYTFIQIGVEDISLDMAGNCGNMSSAVGPFALDEGLISDSRVEKSLCEEHGQKFVTFGIFNTNTSKIIESKFAVTQEGTNFRYEPKGTYSIDGVSGRASPIALSFLSPAGSKTGKMLPSGNKLDQITLPGGSTVTASLVDVANPAVFVKASDVGIAPPCAGATIEDDKSLMSRLEEIRRAGAEHMGLDPEVRSIPKILILSEPRDEDADIRTLALSMGRCHKAVPLTLALNLGVSCSVEGTLPHSLRRRRAESGRNEITIGHASGTLDVQADMQDGEVKSAILMRTARLLMRGEVNCA